MDTNKNLSWESYADNIHHDHSDANNEDIPLDFKVILYPIMLFTSVFLEGWVGKTLWNWFVEPFVGIHLTTLAAAGIGLLWSLWTYQWTAMPDQLTRKQGRALLMHMYLSPVIYVIIGYIIHYWLM